MKCGGRPLLEGIIADDLFSFIRNLLLHFPIFDNWNEVYINKDMATWSRIGQIDKFLEKSIQIKINNEEKIKYRMWDEKERIMIYFQLIFLKNM